MVKVTFTLDDQTVQAIKTMAERKRKPQSLVVREAIAAYGRHEEKLSEEEQQRRLRLLDELKSQPHTRSAVEVDNELSTIRRTRRTGWRRRGE